MKLGQLPNNIGHGPYVTSHSIEITTNQKGRYKNVAY